MNFLLYPLDKQSKSTVFLSLVHQLSWAELLAAVLLNCPTAVSDVDSVDAKSSGSANNDAQVAGNNYFVLFLLLIHFC